MFSLLLCQGVIQEIFITSKHFCAIFQSLTTLKKKIMITCSLTSIFSLFVPASRKGNFLALPSNYQQKIRLMDLFQSFKLFFRQKLTHTRQHFKVSSVKKYISTFSNKIDNSSHKAEENVTISVFSYCLASYPLSNRFLVCLFCIQSYVRRLKQNIPCSNQNMDKKLEKLHFWPRDAGTLTSQKI